MIAEFLDGAEGSDVAVAMVERDVLLTRYPESKRTWLKFRGGWWSGANMFRLRGRRVLLLDHNAEPVFHFRQQASDRHRIQFGQVAEQPRFRSEGRSLLRVEAQHIGDQRLEFAIERGFACCAIDVRNGGH